MIHVERITVTLQEGNNPNNADKEAVLKNYALITHCISEINNTQIDNAKYIDVIMLMYNIIEYINNYSKPSGSLW